MTANPRKQPAGRAKETVALLLNFQKQRILKP